jgi:hypothetical protein
MNMDDLSNLLIEHDLRTSYTTPATVAGEVTIEWFTQWFADSLTDFLHTIHTADRPKHPVELTGDAVSFANALWASMANAKELNDERR